MEETFNLMAKAEHSSDSDDPAQESEKIQDGAEAETTDAQHRQKDIEEERAKKESLSRELLNLSRRSLSLRKSAYLAANSIERFG